MDSFLAYPALVFKSGGHQPVLRTHYDTADKQQQHNQGTHPNYVTKDYCTVDWDFYHTTKENLKSVSTLHIANNSDNSACTKQFIIYWQTFCSEGPSSGILKEKQLFAAIDQLDTFCSML